MRHSAFVMSKNTAANTRQTGSRKAAIALAVSLVLSAALTAWVRVATPLPWDVALAHAVQSETAPWLDTFMRSVTFLSDDLMAIGGVLALAGALALWRWWPEAVVFLGVLLADLLLRVPKVLIDRPRPSAELVRVLETSASGSFPSAHTFHAVVFLGLVLLVLAPRLHNATLRRAAAVCSLALILITGISRIYVGAHWPSDVLGAVAYGVPTVGALMIGYKWLARRAK
ncbi:MAG: phosphatase PAP2 family protein [Chloroflexi bacterium]|nr:phosphatase PAP2 family protein [Chloroflexota bacterium]